MANGIVLHDKKIVYWPVPKNACTTLKAFICELQGLEAPEGNVHDAAFERTNQPIVGYNNFAIVRHPFARLFSLWVNKVAPGHPVHPLYVQGIDMFVFKRWANKIQSGMSFKAFANVIFDIPINQADDHFGLQIGQIPKGIHLIRWEDAMPLMRMVLDSYNTSSNQSWRAAFSDVELLRRGYNYYYRDFVALRYPRFINTILIDCDGVLTDGALTIDSMGEKQFKRFHTKDVRAIRELVYNGFEVSIISTDDWPGIHHFAEKVGADVIITRDKGNIPFNEFIAIGDDSWDIPMLKKAAIAFAPNDAFDVLDSQVGQKLHRLDTLGGRGAVAEMAHILLRGNKCLI